jgi:hypothetical protein
MSVESNMFRNTDRTLLIKGFDLEDPEQREIFIYPAVGIVRALEQRDKNVYPDVDAEFRRATKDFEEKRKRAKLAVGALAISIQSGSGSTIPGLSGRDAQVCGYAYGFGRESRKSAWLEVTRVKVHPAFEGHAIEGPLLENLMTRFDPDFPVEYTEAGLLVPQVEASGVKMENHENLTVAKVRDTLKAMYPDFGKFAAMNISYSPSE